jgi:enediyne biosynthesis protein E4
MLPPLARNTRPPAACFGIACVALFISAALLAPPLARAVSFTDVSTSAPGDTGICRGVTFVDFDGDGFPDLTWSREGTPAVRMARNDRNGHFTEVTPAPMQLGGNSTTLAWADFDNDGDLDLYSCEEETPNHLYRNDGNGVFNDITKGALGDPGHTHGMTWIDYDRDGDVDMFFTDLNTPGHLLRNDGGGNFTDVTTAPLDSTAGGGVAAADYDLDGDTDIFLSRFLLKPDMLFRNDDGVFVDATIGALANAGNGTGVAWGDYDNDGYPDLFIGNAGQSPALLHNLGTGIFILNGQPVFAPAQQVFGVSWVDVDNDGDLDLYVTRAFGQRSALFENQNGVFVDVTVPPLTEIGHSAGCAWGDMDQDGDMDLFIGNVKTDSLQTPNKLYRNNLANGNRWLELELIGTMTNRAAIGTRVEVITPGRHQTREVSGGSGYRSQDMLTLHFGLGTADTAHVRIHWLSGIVKDTTFLTVNRRRTIREILPSMAVPTGGSSPNTLAAAFPNPFVRRAAIVFDLAATTDVRLEIIDLQGRVVRTLADGARPAGRHTAEWDGRDRNGIPVAEGLYFARIAGRGVHGTLRLVRAR